MNTCTYVQLHGVCTKVEGGLDDPNYLGHLDHCLVGQVRLICKLNFLDVTWIFNRLHVLGKKTLASEKRVNLWSGECTEPSLV